MAIDLKDSLSASLPRAYAGAKQVGREARRTTAREGAVFKHPSSATFGRSALLWPLGFGRSKFLTLEGVTETLLHTNVSAGVAWQQARTTSGN